MLSTAAQVTGCETEQQLGEMIGASERTRLLTGLAMHAAERTAWPPQVQALGRVLAAGLIASDDAVDMPQFALNAMVDLDRLHVSLLDLLVRYGPAWTSGIGYEARGYHEAADADNHAWEVGDRIWTAPTIVAVRPQLQPVLTSVVGTLVRYGLADQVDRAREALEQLGKDFEEQINQQAALSRRGGGTGMFTEVRAPEIRGIERSWSPTDLGEQVLGFYLEAGAEDEITAPAAPEINR